MVDLNNIYNEDCLEFMKKLPDNIIDCIITSIPYNFDRNYDTYDDKVDLKEYVDWLKLVFQECSRILKDDGRIFVNVQPIFTDNFPTHHIVSQILTDCGLTWGGEIIWEKNNYNCAYTTWGSWCSPSKPYLKYTWEYIEYFYKNNSKHVGDKSNIDIIPDEFKKWTTAKWSVAPEHRMKEFDHPAMFPEELVERILKLFTYKNDLVYDPFSGVGTTCTVCERLNRKYLGTEISKKYYDTARNRISKEHYLKEKNKLW